MAIIAAVAVPAYSAYVTKAQDSSNVQEVADLAYAAELACIEYTCKVTQTTVAKDKVVLTFTNATAAAQAGKVIGLTAEDKVVTLTFETLKEQAGKVAGEAAKYAANTAAPDATFPYAATNKAFDDSSYAGYGDQACKDLYAEWIKGQDEKDAEMFYDTMLTIAIDGQSYADTNGTDDFVDWFQEQAQNYSGNFSKVEELVKDKSAIVVAVYYNDGVLTCEVYSSEADPRN